MSGKPNIPLVELPHELRRLTDRPERVPTYRQSWDAAVNGRIPAERKANGKGWEVRRENLPAVMAAFGLTADSIAA